MAMIEDVEGPLSDLFEIGLSFKLMCTWKLLPPLHVFNDFLACGRDDTDSANGLLEWEPFALSDEDYLHLQATLAARGHTLSIEQTKDGKTYKGFHEWFTSKM